MNDLVANSGSCEGIKYRKNLYRFKLVNSKNLYINSRINTTKDQKEMWNRIKNLVLGKSRNLI